MQPLKQPLMMGNLVNSSLKTWSIETRLNSFKLHVCVCVCVCMCVCASMYLCDLPDSYMHEPEGHTDNVCVRIQIMLYLANNLQMLQPPWRIVDQRV